MTKKKRTKGYTKRIKDLRKQADEMGLLEKETPEAVEELDQGYIKMDKDAFYALLSFTATSNLFFEAARSEDSGPEKAPIVGELWSNMKAIQHILKATVAPDEGSLLDSLHAQSEYIVTRYQHLLNEADAQAVKDEAEEYAKLIRESLEDMLADSDLNVDDIVTGETPVLTTADVDNIIEVDFPNGGK